MAQADDELFNDDDLAAIQDAILAGAVQLKSRSNGCLLVAIGALQTQALLL
ncbi:hypothetical protein OH492_09120 [Vibrio chagasii]|nr:hypothetical protein [Vibrio chagasii]